MDAKAYSTSGISFDHPKFEGRPVITPEKGLRLLFIALGVTETDALVPTEAHSVYDERYNKTRARLWCTDGNPLVIHDLFLICPTFSVENIRVLVRVLAKMGPAEDGARIGTHASPNDLGVGGLGAPLARGVALPALGDQTGFDAGELGGFKPSAWRSFGIIVAHSWLPSATAPA